MLKNSLTLYPKLPPSGFTMMEVLLAILTVTLFLTGTLQLVAINTLYKIKNKQEAQATFWIQEDLEEIRELATKGQELDDPLYDYLWEKSRCSTNKQEETYAYALQVAIKERDDSADNPLPGSAPRALLASNTTASQNSKQYEMRRTLSIDMDKPNVLKINYEVRDIDAEDKATRQNKDINKDPIIAEQYAEVIPNVSFKCP